MEFSIHPAPLSSFQGQLAAQNNHAGCLVMRQLSDSDFSQLFRIYNNPDTKHLWLPDEKHLTLEQFRAHLVRRITHRWDDFFVFEITETHIIVGFAYCYQSSKLNKTACLCINIDRPYMSTHISLKACYLYSAFLFEQRRYRKLFAEVFAYNNQCLGLLKKLKFEQEGCLKQYQWWKSHYWDLFIFSITKNTHNHLKKSYQAILNRPSWKSKTN